VELDYLMACKGSNALANLYLLFISLQLAENFHLHKDKIPFLPPFFAKSFSA